MECPGEGMLDIKHNRFDRAMNRRFTIVNLQIFSLSIYTSIQGLSFLARQAQKDCETEAS